MFHHLGRSRADFWEAVAPWVDEFPAASLDFQSYLREVAGTAVGPNTLDGMARLLPGSNELRDTCLVDLRTATLQRLPLTNVPRILGTHFGGQGIVLARIVEILESIRQEQFDRVVYWRLLLSLCYGWPDVPVVQEWLARPRVNWKGMPWHIALHLDRIARKPDWFLNDILGCLEASAPYDHVRDDEIPKVLTLWASGEANRSLLTTMLGDAHGSDVATATGLLSQGGAMGEELKRRLEELFEAEVGASQRPPRVGLALSQDRLRSLAEILFEALGGIRDRPL